MIKIYLSQSRKDRKENPFKKPGAYLLYLLWIELWLGARMVDLYDAKIYLSQRRQDRKEDQFKKLGAYLLWVERASAKFVKFF